MGWLILLLTEAKLKELKFLFAVWKANLQSVMEYRGAFLLQAFGMMVNNGIYFLIWVIFFDRFKDVRGWQLGDMFITYGIVASSFGLVSMLFGNAFNLGDIITKGRLDYYLSLPRPVLLHALASRSIASGFGDFTYGAISYQVNIPGMDWEDLFSLYSLVRLCLLPFSFLFKA